jgi:hypothetical protein
MFLLTALTVFSCSKMNDVHQEYLDRGETVYAAKVDSIIVRTGNKRAQLDLYYSINRIKKCVIYWNVRNDSLVVDLPAPNPNGHSVILNNLSEGSYAFEIFTVDGSNNRSLVVETSGRVYGDNYAISLANANITNAEFVNGAAEIEWAVSVGDNGIVAVQGRYQDKDNVQHDTTLLISSGASGKTIIRDFLKGSKFEYRTLYQPTPLSLDVFYTEYRLRSVRADVTSDYMRNYSYPFARAGWDNNRWGSLQDWIINDAMKTRGGNQYGGYDHYQDSETFGFERWGSGEGQILNGKIYQTATLPEGKYQFTFSYGGACPVPSNNGSNPRFLTANAGTSLPDVDQISSSLAFTSLVGVGTGSSKTIEFTLTRETEVSLGIVVYFDGIEQNIRGSYFQLYKVE